MLERAPFSWENGSVSQRLADLSAGKGLAERMSGMFDMNKIGRKIAELRKQADLTQFALADKLGISFQAVSNWERGVSMPDISKLPELAGLFGVPIDEILGEDAPLVVRAAEGNLGEYIAENPVSPEELREAAAMLPPKGLETVISSVEDDLGQLAVFLPFVSTGFVDRLAESRISEGKVVAPMLPFISGGKLPELMALSQEKGRGIAEFLPFLPSAELRERAFAAVRENGMAAASIYLPFMRTEDVEEMLELLRNQKKTAGLENLP